MRQFHTSVLERKKEFTGVMSTHPYEVGWAREAIFFVRVESVSGVKGSLVARVQISADGVNWVDEGTATEPLERPGNSFVRVHHFGGWLRLYGEVKGDDARFVVTVQLALKE